MNKNILIGRLTKDPELRYTGSGVAVCKFTLAVDRPFTNKEGKKEADFIDIVCWRLTAENVAKYVGKGRQVAVEGRLQIRSYDDSQGIRRKAAEIIADNVEFLGSKNDQNQNNNQGQGNYQGQGQNGYNDQGQNNYQGQGQGQNGYQGQGQGQNSYQGQGQGYTQQGQGNTHGGDQFGSEISFNEEDLPF